MATFYIDDEKIRPVLDGYEKARKDLLRVNLAGPQNLVEDAQRRTRLAAAELAEVVLAADLARRF